MTFQKTVQRPECIGINKLHDGVQLFNFILQWRARKYKPVTNVERLDGAGNFGIPVFDALCFVQNDQIGSEDAVDQLGILYHHIVSDDFEKTLVVFILGFTLVLQSFDDQSARTREFFNFGFPLVLERSGANDQGAADAVLLAE